MANVNTVPAYARFTPSDAHGRIAVPRADSDKYSRGVLGVVTGSDQYPGAAVLGVDAALHTGVGMLRYLGDERPTALVLARRPESVTADGRVQAWLVGSGMSDERCGHDERVARALAQGVPAVLDGGAIGLAAASGALHGPAILTPHAGEAARLLGVERARVEAEPGAAADEIAERTGATVLLKGATTHVSDGTTRLAVAEAPAWLATAGAGDALGGILGAIVATHHAAIADDAGVLVPLAATAALVHGLAATAASAGGPFTILELIARVPGVVAALAA